MYQKRVKDLMIPVSEYPTVNQDAFMIDAIIALKTANDNIEVGKKHYRAVLVSNNEGKVVGKIGHISFLKALEPKYNDVFDMEKLSRLSLSRDFIDSMVQHYNLWGNDSLDLCTIAKTLTCKSIMLPIEQRIEENDSITEAIHKIIMWQTLSLLVTSGDEIIGIIRLSEIYDSIRDHVIYSCNKTS